MDNQTLHFPQIKGRLEDQRLITGAGRFIADTNLPGQVHGVFLRADRPHAVIRSIDASAALAMKGVLAVLTGEDMKKAGLKSLPAALAVNGRDGKPLNNPFRPALAIGKVRYVGETVALVIADSAVTALDATEALVVDYEDLPAVVRAVDAMKPDAPQLHDTVTGNRVFDFGPGDEAKTDAAFKAAKMVVRLSIYNNRVIASPLETRGAIAVFDASKDYYQLYSCTQGVNGLRGQICGVFGIGEDKLDIIGGDVGGGFGVRSQVYPEYCALMVAAKQLGRPVKWISSRSEAFLSDEQGRDVVATGEASIDENARFLALRFNFISNLGAYVAPTGAFVNSRVTACMTGLYDVPVASARNQFILTNTAPMAAYRGAGRPIMSAILERLVNQVAIETGIDAAEVRRRNMITPSKFPYTLVNGIVYDCGEPEAAMQDALVEAKWSDSATFEKRRAEAKARGKLLGRGLATCIESTGMGGPADEVVLNWKPDGNIQLYAVSYATGQGHETTYANIVAGVLGVPVESIRLKEGDPDMRLAGSGTGGSRSTHGAGGSMFVVANDVVKKGKALASDELEAAEADIEFHDGEYRVSGTDRKVSLVSLAKKFATQSPHPLDTKSNTKVGATFPYGAHVAEVEIDPDTGTVQILSYIACDDAGTIINHQLVEGQMHGSLTQGAGQVLGEFAHYDLQTGQLLSGSYMDYPMPKAGMFGKITLLDHPVPTDTNPLGAKGVGEAGVTGSLPTLMNAILDALRPVGVTHLDMPATPSRVWTAIQAAKAGKPAALAVPQD